jgi:hypothetical protein
MEVVAGMGDAVHVEYDLDHRGGIAEIRVRVGENARATDVAGHVPTIETLARYRGFLGRVRTLIDRVRAWITNNGEPPLGTRAWEARHELEKLPRLINERVSRLRDASPLERAGLLDEIAALEQQIEAHTRTLDEMDLDPGVGFIAMGKTGRKGGDKLPGNWRKRLDDLDAHLAAPGRDGKDREARAAAAAELARLRAKHMDDPEQLYRSLIARSGFDPADARSATESLAKAADGRLRASSTLGATGAEFGRLVGAVHAAGRRGLESFEQFIASRDAAELFGDARHWDEQDRAQLERSFQEAKAAAAAVLAHATTLRGPEPAPAPTAPGELSAWTAADLAHHSTRQWEAEPGLTLTELQARMDDWVRQRDSGVPFGFRDQAHFEQFRQALVAAVRSLRRGRDAELFLQGSAVTGFSFEKQLPFGGHSDFDVAIVSPDLFAEAERRGFEVLKNPRHIGPLTLEEAAELGLDAALSAGATVLGPEMGRDINFMLFENPNAAYRPIGQNSRETTRASRNLGT